MNEPAAKGGAVQRYTVTGHPLAPPAAAPIQEWMRDLIHTTSIGQQITIAGLTPEQVALFKDHGILA